MIPPPSLKTRGGGGVLQAASTNPIHPPPPCRLPQTQKTCPSGHVFVFAYSPPTHCHVLVFRCSLTSLSPRTRKTCPPGCVLRVRCLPHPSHFLEHKPPMCHDSSHVDPPLNCSPTLHNASVAISSHWTPKIPKHALSGMFLVCSSIINNILFDI